MKKIICMLFLFLTVTACNMPQPAVDNGDEQSQIETLVAVTSEALTLQAVPPPITSETPGNTTPTDTIEPTITFTITPDVTNTPEPGFGSISGSIVGYPYGSIPQLSIVAFEQTAPYHYWYLILAAGSSYFSMDGYVSTGKYQVVAYDSSGHAGGCTSLVQVKNNETVSCDISNWGAGYPAKPAGVP
jgi:hypothetical protein